MAGDWIVWRKGLTRKLEILQLSSRLHLAPAHTAGLLMQLMEWVDENVSDFDHDGNAHVTLGPLQSSSLDVTLGVTGFMEALAEVGWLRSEGDTLVFVHVGRHNGQTAKQRALTKNRVAAHRANAPVTHAALPEKRREEKKSIPPLPPAGGQGVLIELPPAAKPPGREPDLLFEAACALLQVDYRKINGLERGKINTGLKAILETDPSATPEELRSRAGRYRKAYPTIKFSVVGLASHWSELAGGPPSADQVQQNRYRRQWTEEIKGILALEATDEPDVVAAREAKLADLNAKLKSLQ
jgi:hypothetical protein